MLVGKQDTGVGVKTRAGINGVNNVVSNDTDDKHGLAVSVSKCHLQSLQEQS
jgi:hypothetical protein